MIYMSRVNIYWFVADAHSSGSDADGYGPSTLSVESDKKQYMQSGKLNI